MASASLTKYTWLLGDRNSKESSQAVLIIGCDVHTRHQQIVMAEHRGAKVLLEQWSDHESGEPVAAIHISLW
jgi:hypothetical protein